MDGKELLLILDDIAGVSKDVQLAGFLKSWVDAIGVETPRLPFMMLICATEERGIDVIKTHQSVARIFDHVELRPMEKNEVKEFMQKHFHSSTSTLMMRAWKQCLP